MAVLFNIFPFVEIENINVLHGKASIMILVSSTKKYNVNSAITLYHATFTFL
jgi:hypothetical protein